MKFQKRTAGAQFEKRKMKKLQTDTTMAVRPCLILQLILFRLLMLVCAFFYLLHSIVQGLIRFLCLSGSAQTNNQCVKVNNSLQKNVATEVLYAWSVAESQTRICFRKYRVYRKADYYLIHMIDLDARMGLLAHWRCTSKQIGRASCRERVCMLV